ncbi:MAG: diguanylate cyclase [Magnetococcales bacterium]|nr:diguanylate cyclase [Magnetococcales bacterium]
MNDTVRLDAQDHGRLWRNFLVEISVVLLIFTLGAFVGILSGHKQLIEAEMLSRARAHVRDIVLTRRWNASYGGVYVEKRAGVLSNPYLKNPDITSTAGMIYTLKNPALMTREISELSEKDSDYRFHLTSLNLRNPSNAPDPWEREALLAFNTGLKETSAIITTGTGSQFRYMVPLLVEPKCLECHADQGYREGDVRGGISVSFDITPIQKGIEQSRLLLIGLTVVLFILLLGVVYLFVSKVYRQLDVALVKLREMATTDVLTGLFNRRHFFDQLANEISRHKRYRRDLSCIFMDLDHFKKINDQHGHAIGDEALRAMGKLLRKRCRQEDICARYGGEEVVILLPETALEKARTMAEVLRQQVAETPIPLPSGETFYLTASFGVAAIAGDSDEWSEAAEALLLRADRAVYRAKEQGRNRVVVERG